MTYRTIYRTSNRTDGRVYNNFRGYSVVKPMYFSGTTVDFWNKTLQNVFKTFLKRFFNGLKRHKEIKEINVIKEIKV